MRISHEALYQALHVQGRGRCAGSWWRACAQGERCGCPEYPHRADDRIFPGHWKGDLILRLDSSAIGILVERSTRFTMLLHLSRMESYGDGPRSEHATRVSVHQGG